MGDQKMKIEELRARHQEAMAARRALERETREIDGELTLAIHRAEADEIIRLTRRKADLPTLLIQASSIESGCMKQHYQAQAARELALAAEAEAQAVAARDRLERRRAEVADELRALEAEATKRQVAHNTRVNEVEAWTRRRSVADQRYREVVGALSGSL